MVALCVILEYQEYLQRELGIELLINNLVKYKNVEQLDQRIITEKQRWLNKAKTMQTLTNTCILALSSFHPIYGIKHTGKNQEQYIHTRLS